MGRYADGLLADGESVALRSRQHVLATVVEGRIPWVLAILAIVFVLFGLQQQPGLFRDLVFWASLVGLVVGGVWLGRIYLNWYVQDYLVTNRRVLKVEGIFNKRSADSSLEKINDAVLSQSMLGRMIGFGNLEIMTASEESVDRYYMLDRPATFKKTMLDMKHRLEQDAFRIPAPPMRASAPGPVASAAPAMPMAAPESAGTPMAASAEPMPAAAPAPAGPRAMSAEEITRALDSLADLRDRGAITPEEYEAKKTELLDRL